MMSMNDNVIHEIRELFRKKGNSNYGGEEVTQLEHALQAGALAESQGADAATIAASFLHDIGHLLHDLPEDAPENDIDDLHEKRADKFLSKYFPPQVTEPIRLHVAAKRYLCTVDPSYRSNLSEPSLQSLMLQGGDLSSEEVEEFEGHEFHEAIVMVRRFDDRAKDPEMATPDIEHFLPYVEKCILNDKVVEAN